MGLEVPSKYDGPEANFFNTVIVVEELARIDPSVSVYCDVQNTLVAPLIIQLGTEEQRNKYLTRVTKDWVSISFLHCRNTFPFRLVLFVFLKLAVVLMHLL